MKLVVGLGNPGEKYQRTRHNIGFMVLDHLLEDIEPLSKTFWDDDRKHKGLIKKIKLRNEDVFLFKPTTFMNNSGIAVKSISDFYRIDSTNIYIVHDDVDLPLGRLRVRFGGAAGGHKGVESIMQSLKTDQFLRIRLGIGRPAKISHPSTSLRARKLKVKNQKSIEDYVLSEFSSSEKGALKHLVKRAVKSIQLILEHGVEKYMSKYHNQVKS